MIFSCLDGKRSKSTTGTNIQRPEKASQKRKTFSLFQFVGLALVVSVGAGQKTDAKTETAQKWVLEGVFLGGNVAMFQKPKIENCRSVDFGASGNRHFFTRTDGSPPR